MGTTTKLVGLALAAALLIPAPGHADDHETEVRAACRHILSPAMATAHQSYEKYIYWRCVELQMKVPWRLPADEYQ